MLERWPSVPTLKIERLSNCRRQQLRVLDRRKRNEGRALVKFAGDVIGSLNRESRLPDTPEPCQRDQTHAVVAKHRSKSLDFVLAADQRCERGRKWRTLLRRSRRERFNR